MELLDVYSSDWLCVRGFNLSTLRFCSLTTFDSKKYEAAVSVARLPYPLDPKVHQQITVKENGQDLSGGERQRLLLARALYGVKDVLLLDEALSALDANLRSDILKDITVQLTDVTILYISHNTSDRKIFTREVVLER